MNHQPMAGLGPLQGRQSVDIVIDLARQEPLLHLALFNAVSAHRPYREIIRESLQPRLAFKLAKAAGASLLGLTSQKPRSERRHSRS